MNGLDGLTAKTKNPWFKPGNRCQFKSAPLQGALERIVRQW